MTWSSRAWLVWTPSYFSWMLFVFFHTVSLTSISLGFDNMIFRDQNARMHMESLDKLWKRVNGVQASGLPCLFIQNPLFCRKVSWHCNTLQQGPDHLSLANDRRCSKQTPLCDQETCRKVVLRIRDASLASGTKHSSPFFQSNFSSTTMTTANSEGHDPSQHEDNWLSNMKSVDNMLALITRIRRSISPMTMPK